MEVDTESEEEYLSDIAGDPELIQFDEENTISDTSNEEEAQEEETEMLMREEAVTNDNKKGAQVHRCPPFPPFTPSDNLRKWQEAGYFIRARNPWETTGQRATRKEAFVRQELEDCPGQERFFRNQLEQDFEANEVRENKRYLFREQGRVRRLFELEASEKAEYNDHRDQAIAQAEKEQQARQLAHTQRTLKTQKRREIILRRVEQSARRRRTLRHQERHREAKLRRQHRRRLRRRYNHLDGEACYIKMTAEAHQAMGKRMTPCTNPPTRDHFHELYGLVLDPATVNKIIEQQSLLQEQQQPLIFYSDGSLIEAGKEDVSMAFGVVVPGTGDTFRTAIVGKVAGFASSTKAELAGLLATILICPPGREAKVYIDNSAVVDQFQSLVRNRTNATERQRLRSPYSLWWAIVHCAYIKQEERVTVEWVKGHAGNKGNEAADRAAKSGHQHAIWNVDPAAHTDLHAHARYRGQLVEDDLRQVLKKQTAARKHHHWTGQNRVCNMIKDWKKIEWQATLGIIHDRQQPRGRFTSSADCSKRAHRLKKMHGMLPTLQYMQRWKPHLYPTDECRVCETETESTGHLWMCPATLQQQKEQWEQAIECGRQKGKEEARRARIEYKKALDEHDNKQKVALLDGTPLPETFKMAQPRFKDVADTSTVWDLLETIMPDIAVMLENEGNQESDDDEMDWRGEEHREDTDSDEEMEGTEAEGGELEEENTWSIKDLYHGLVPQELVLGWKLVFGTTARIAQYMVDKFASSIEEFGRTEIWNNRCNVTVAWEKSISITARKKKIRSSSGNDNFNALNPQHRKPEMKAIYCIADTIVMESYLGQRRLHLMEKGGGVKFIKSKVAG